MTDEELAKIKVGGKNIFQWETIAKDEHGSVETLLHHIREAINAPDETARLELLQQAIDFNASSVRARRTSAG